MILIADSGSTKTDWAVADCNGANVSIVHTQGINPFHQTEGDIESVISGELLPQIRDLGVVERVAFYGTGCTEDMSPVVAGVLRRAFGCEVAVGSDLLGAARAVCGHSEGIACILGTGANSCVYDGENIVANTPPLGYILGDEGSGAVLGKLFLNALFKGRLSAEVRKAYLEETGQEYADIIRRVYSEPMANRYLATVSRFVGCHLAEFPELVEIVSGNFADFISHNIDVYRRRDLPLCFVGSVAWHFQDILSSVATGCGYSVGRIMQSPIGGMVEYESGKPLYTR